MALSAALLLYRWWWIPLALAIPYLLAWISRLLLGNN
jgi:hypothetical protein